MTKDISKISSTPTQTVPVTLDEDIVGYKKLNLIAKINHSGNLARGHHTSFIKSTSSSWFHCNDFAVIPSNETALNNDTFYFFPKKLYLENMRKRERGVIGKQVLITSGVLHPCPLHSSNWYFSYMRFTINFQGNKLPLMTILDLFRGGPACYPKQQLVWWYCFCPSLLYVSNFRDGTSATLVVSLGVTTPLIIPVTFSKVA